MSSITYIDLPLRGTNKVDGHDVLVVGLAVFDDRVGEVVASEGVSAICVNDDGDMKHVPLEAININWRFDDRRRKWLDVDTGEELGGDDGDDDS